MKPQTQITPIGQAGPQAFRFFANPEFEFNFLIAFGRAYYGGGDIGRLLVIVEQIKDGDSESAYQAFRAAGDEAYSLATTAAQRGHTVSARQAYLWAANYYDAATYFVDATAQPERFLPTWEKSRDCWDEAVALFDPPVERIEIPYENTRLQGYFFRTHAPGKRPLLILGNGSDGSPLGMWHEGGAAGVARGYHCLTFDGPGQGYALWKQGLYFRPDWEKVISPVVDYALTRTDIDPKRIALQGRSQGGFWVPRAVAFEHRIAAVIADGGVMDVSSIWMDKLPEPMKALLAAGNKDEFDQFMGQIPTRGAAMLRFRMRPYGMTSYYDVFKAVQEYNLESVVDQIRCPMLITDPEDEQFFSGQPQALYERLTGPKRLVPFTAAEGSNLHCEPRSLGLRDMRVFDWLDETLAAIK
jgi:dienelactone hydrolase